MGKVLYSAIDKYGNTQSGFIDASSNKEAMQQLKQNGLKKIKFYSDALFSTTREDIESLKEKELENIAKREIKNQQGFTFKEYAFETLKSSFLPIMAGVGVLYYGYSIHSAIVMALGVIIAIAFPFFKLWNYNVIKAHDGLIKAVTIGAWEHIPQMSENLRTLSKQRKKIFPGSVNKDLIIQADTMEAFYYAHKKDIKKAISLLAPHREYLDKKQPSLYENKIAQLYYYAHDFDKFLLKLNQCNIIANTDITRADLALAYARFGSVDDAQNLIDQIDESLIPDYGTFQISYIKGLIAYRNESLDDAENELFQAYLQLLKYKDNPLMLEPMAIVTGTLAVVLYDNKKSQETKMLFDNQLIHILKVHGDKYLLDGLKQRFKDIF